MKRATLVLAAAVLAAAALPAAAAMTPEQAKAKVEKDLAVKVLDVREVWVEGERAYALRVMREAGDYNGALGVATLAVNPEDGRLLPMFRHQTSGYALSGGATYVGERHPAGAAREGFTWR